MGDMCYEMPLYLQVGQAAARPHTYRQGVNGFIPPACFPCSVPSRQSPVLWLHKRCQRWLLGRRHRRTEKYTWYQGPQAGAQRHGSACGDGLHHWIMECSGEACSEGAVYTTEGYGFLCIPRDVTERLVRQGYRFGESDAWLDLWCHTVWGDRYNAFSRLAPTIQIMRGKPILTLESLGARWGWEKTKVWRFLKKNADTFCLHKLPGSYGCLIFNHLYPADVGPVEAPTDAVIMRVLNEIRFMGQKTHYSSSDHERINLYTLWFSNRIELGNLNDGCPSQSHPAVDRVAVFTPYNTRAYSSLPKSTNDCAGSIYRERRIQDLSPPRPRQCAWP